MKLSSASRLYLLPNSIGSAAVPVSPECYVTPMMRNVCAAVKVIFAEDLKSVRRLFRTCGYTGDFSELEILLLNEHTHNSQYQEMLDLLIKSGAGALVSDAGIPCVADPGSDLVAMAHERGIEVVPMSGPSSIVLTLAASGLGGQRFNFNGYLPKDSNERRKKIKQMELELGKGITQIFMDTPYRNLQVLEDLFAVCRKTVMLCIGCEVTTDKGFVLTKSIDEWMQLKPDLNKRPVIFALGLRESIH